MRKVFLVAASMALVLLAGVTASSAFQKRSELAAAQADRLRLQREFDERAAVLRALPADGTLWRDEVNVLLRSHLQSLSEVRNRYPKAAAAAEDERKTKAAGKDSALAPEFQRYAEGRMALLSGGAYAPSASAVGGGLRLDVVAIQAEGTPNGPQLRIDFALWGAPRFLDREQGRDGSVSRTVVPIAFKNLQFRLLDAGGKQYGEMSGPGEPTMRLDTPERFVADFPPGVLFGTWWVDLLPREAVTMELKLDLESRAPSGAAIPASFTVSLPVQEPWRIPPGARYEAQVREAAPSVGQ
jgi:hypothetical protein